MTAISSHSNSYTSLDRIKTPPIGTQLNGSDQTSDFSVEIDVSSRSKGSASVGTSRVRDVFDEVEIVSDNSSETLHSNSESLKDINSFDRHANRSLPLEYKTDDHKTPINSKNRHLLTKSFSSNYLPYTNRRQLTSTVDPSRRHKGVFAVPPVRFQLSSLIKYVIFVF